MNTILKKVVSIIAISMLICISCLFPVSAEILFEKAGGGRADTIYVAGNPNAYPIEYYDTESESYKGVIPNMLQTVSNEIGIDFTYISSGKENRQKSLCKNKQVELITAICIDDNEFDNVEEYTILTVETDGKVINYGIGFTEVATEELKAKIKAAFANISEAQKNGFLLDIANPDRALSTMQIIIIISISVIALALIIFALIFVYLRKKRKSDSISGMIDENTGLGNANYYIYAFNELIREQSKNLYNLAYISFDIKAFEKFQNSVSLRDIEKFVAVKLNTYTTETDYLSRISDGAFVLLFQSESEKALESKIAEIISGINQSAQGHEITFRAGICRLCENVGADSEAALYSAKQSYLYAESTNLPYHTGSNSQIAASKRYQSISSQINDALAKNEFKIHMQLISEGKTGAFCGAEVLSRWQNKEYGLLRPHEYIDILNSTGKIVEHDYCIFENVCSRLEMWNKPPFDDMFLTCNFTRLSVSKDDFAEKIDLISKKYNFSHSRLVIEITEDSLGSNSQTVSENIAKCSKLGFKVAIDDMGTGFSSLSDIYDNKIDIVKIERNFVASCNTERHQRMLGDIISLVHNAGAKVICEGVESAEQMDMLKNINCDMMQGFYNSRVIPVEECEKFIKIRASK